MNCRFFGLTRVNLVYLFLLFKSTWSTKSRLNNFHTIEFKTWAKQRNGLGFFKFELLYQV